MVRRYADYHPACSCPGLRLHTATDSSANTAAHRDAAAADPRTVTDALADATSGWHGATACGWGETCRRWGA